MNEVYRGFVIFADKHGGNHRLVADRCYDSIGQARASATRMSKLGTRTWIAKGVERATEWEEV